MRQETQTILKDNFTIEEQKIIVNFEKIFEKDNVYRNKEIQREIWEYDQKLLGLGGYAMPLNPEINPFNHMKEYRNVFRSLQYARCDIFNLVRGRHIICDSGLHIESLVKIILSKNKLFFMKKNHRLLGKNILELKQEKIIDEILYTRLMNLVALYNLAKHDTDANNSITFSILDGITFYFACRKIGNILLEIIGHSTCNKKYEVNEIIKFEEIGIISKLKKRPSSDLQN